jgi:hypothetical protein
VSFFKQKPNGVEVMKVRALLVALALLIALPATVAAADPVRVNEPGSYTVERISLGTDSQGREVFALLESIVVNGRLTETMRGSGDWRALANQRPATRAPLSAVVTAATSYKTIGRRYTALNYLNGVVIQYTIWQEFGYDGRNIVYTPAPVKDHIANFGWSLTSHSETAWWITPPTYRASRGTFTFKRLIWSPFGDIGVGEKSSWVQVNYRGSGSWTGSNGS